MPHSPLGEVVHFLRKACAVQEARDQSDSELLRRFVAHRDEAAFAALVRRHGPMVLGICQRILRDSHAAEDGFQATFLVLVRRAAAIAPTEPLGGWLYAVAQRIALKARAQAAKRRVRERRPDRMPNAETLDEHTWEDLRGVLDEEIGRLPQKYRNSIVLCYFQEKTHDQAAKELGCPRTSLTNRVTRARELLRQQLVRRGIALSAGLLVTVLSEKALGARVGALLTLNTVKAALTFAAGKSLAAGCISAQALALGKGAMPGLLGLKGKILLLVLALGLTAAGAGLAGFGGFGEKPQPTKMVRTLHPTARTGETSKPQKEAPPATDVYGDPLPDDAISRLGTVRLRLGSYGASSLHFSSDGKSVISEGGNGVKIWDADSGAQLRFFPNGEDWLGSSLSKDGNYLAIPSMTAVDIYEVATGKRVKRVDTGKVNLPRFSPNGKILAVQSLRPKLPSLLELWDVETGQFLRAGGEGASFFACLAFTPDGKTLITAGRPTHLSPPPNDHTICFWEASSGKQLLRIPTGTANAQHIAVSPDGTLLAVICEVEGPGPDNRIRIYDLATGKELRQLVHTAGEISQYCYDIALGFAPDGRTLITGGTLATSGSIADTMITWNPVTGQELRRVRTGSDGCTALAISPDNKTVIAAGGGGAIHVFDAETGKDRVTRIAHSLGVLHTAVTPNGSTVITADGGQIFVWDAKSGQALNRLEGDKDKFIAFADLINGGRDLLTFEMDDAGSGKVLRVRDLATAKELQRTAWQKGEADAFTRLLAFAPGGKTLAMVGHRGSRVALVDSASGKELRTLGKLEAAESICGAAFTAGGRAFATWSSDLQIRVWNVDDGLLTHQFTIALDVSKHRIPFGGPTPVIQGALSPDGRLGAFNRQNESLLAIYDLATGKLVRRVDAIADIRWPAVFSPDSRSLACGGGTIHLLEVATGRERQSLPGHPDNVFALAFSADGKTLVSGGQDTTALVWDLTGNHTSAKMPLAKRLADVELAACWADLAGEDAALGYQATRRLAAAPGTAVPFLRAQLAPVPAVDEKRLAHLIADLDRDEFRVRQAATKELEDIGDGASGALQKALASKQSLELVRRVQGLLDKIAKDWQSPGPKNLRVLRALETLELAGTPEAREVLERLAAGDAGRSAHPASGGRLRPYEGKVKKQSAHFRRRPGLDRLANHFFKEF
jgi:RNA polymerase sigma factor (sigma-70 family)